MGKYDDFEERLKKKLSAKRYRHTLGVAYTAASMAMAYDYDVEKAYLAGLLHDCAKGYDNDKILKLCEKYKLPIRDVERKNPQLLHAKLGSYLARKEYEIQDPEILNSILYHTTGRPDMGLLEKIVFVADYIEPNRKPIPNLDNVRHYAFCDLDRAVLLELEGTLNYVKTKAAALDEITLETYHFYEVACKKHRDKAI